MTILIYNWKDIKNPLVGGAEIITFEYARRLVKEGHQVTWFCRGFKNAPDTEVIDGVTVIRRGRDLTTYWAGYKYYQALDQKPDIVIDMLNTIAWQTPLYATKQSKVVQYVNQLAKEVWGYQMRPPAAWLGRFLEPIQLIPYHNMPVVTYAPSTADDLVNWGYNRDKIKQFRLGLDHDRYKPGKKADYPLFVQVCRMVPNKRPDLTVRAFAEVAKEFPEAKLALVGTGPFGPALQKLIKELELNDKVMMPDKDIWFFDKAKGDQKVRLMQEAWCFVHPSVKEGWGMVITEAAACGTPSIATAVTGQVDAIKDGETGILVSKNPTVEELAEAMTKIVIDKELRETLSKNAIAWAGEFNWDKSYDLFKTALSEASGLPILPPVKTEASAIKDLPPIAIVTPVFNAERALVEFFEGIEQTTYPREKISIIMPDGGSTDKTKEIAKAHGALILHNPLTTAEAGKAVGVKHVLAEAKKKHQSLDQLLICMLDSDNIITDPDWFERMVEPFQKEKSVIGSEPWEYTRRAKDAYVTRYSAMMGMSDPVTMFLGNYDRQNVLTGTWTGLPLKTKDKGNYLVWTINAKMVPTIGANGTIFRANFFEQLDMGDYLFDIDLLYEYTLTHQADFAKVKIGIVHLYCRTLKDFVRKQRRRIKDFHYFHTQGLRHYPWTTINRWGLLSFVFACLTVVPLIWHMVKGYSRKPDSAWLFHPLACWATLWIYGTNTILNTFQKPSLADRKDWSQS